MNDEFDPMETLDGDFPKPEIVEPDIDTIPNCTIGSTVRVCKIDASDGLSIAETSESDLRSGQHAPDDGVHKGQCMYYGPSERTSAIDHIDKMADGSYWIHTQNSVYRVEVLASNIVEEDTETTQFEVTPADREKGGTKTGNQRLDNRGKADDVLGTGA
tara:strand:- start:106 stop:582 length:477 start_codon:yes stop_codon:yes gene_type:complete